MNGSDGDDLAPAVASILAAARERGPEGSEGRGVAGQESAADPGRPERVSVEARSLSGALGAAAADGRVPLIAEIKPTSPTTDGERRGDPTAYARAMVDGGAAALSVLTEPEHFGGSLAALEAVRAAVDVPVLRKDFLLDETQLDAVAADCVLLIARFVDDLDHLIDAARDRGFQVFVEVHDRDELDRALDGGASIVGVNNRDLAQLEVDLDTFERAVSKVPSDAREDVTLIAESGISTTADAARMRRAGADGLLVGSAIMDDDPAAVRANTRRLTTPAEEPASAVEPDAPELSEVGR
jgi:indole-3-glycerol phosphate synthase